jgi:hypothetical protein
MNTRIAFVIAAVAGIGFAIPAGAEEVGVGVTVGSGHDAVDRKIVIRKDRDHDGDVDKKVVIKKDRD